MSRAETSSIRYGFSRSRNFRRYENDKIAVASRSVAPLRSVSSLPPKEKNKHASVSRFLYIRHSRNDVHVDVIQTYRRRPRVRCRRQRIYFYVSLARVNSPRWTPRGNPPGRVRRVHLWRWIPPGYTGSWHDERIIYARGIRNKIQYVQCCISSVIYLANCQCIISLFTFIFVCIHCISYLFQNNNKR